MLIHINQHNAQGLNALKKNRHFTHEKKNTLAHSVVRFCVAWQVLYKESPWQNCNYFRLCCEHKETS